MANEKIPLRLPPILHDYLYDLADLGMYGKGKTDVVRRFVEDGTQKAIEKKVITKRTMKDYSDTNKDKSE